MSSGGPLSAAGFGLPEKWRVVFVPAVHCLVRV